MESRKELDNLWLQFKECGNVVASNTIQDGGLIDMGENSSLRVFKSSTGSPILDGKSRLTRWCFLSQI